MTERGRAATSVCPWSCSWELPTAGQCLAHPQPEKPECNHLLQPYKWREALRQAPCQGLHVLYPGRAVVLVAVVSEAGEDTQGLVEVFQGVEEQGHGCSSDHAEAQVDV